MYPVCTSRGVRLPHLQRAGSAEPARFAAMPLVKFGSANRFVTSREFGPTLPVCASPYCQARTAATLTVAPSRRPANHPTSPTRAAATRCSTPRAARRAAPNPFGSAFPAGALRTPFRIKRRRAPDSVRISPRPHPRCGRRRNWESGAAYTRPRSRPTERSPWSVLRSVGTPACGRKRHARLGCERRVLAGDASPIGTYATRRASRPSDVMGHVLEVGHT